MDLNLPVTPATITPEQRTVAETWGLVSQTGVQLLGAYKRLRVLAGYTASGKNPHGLTVEQAFAAIEASKTGNLDAQALGELAKIIKAVLNYVKPGTVIDDVPEATITLPSA